MALITTSSKCFVCGELLGDKDDVFATSHFIEDERHPLWKYSDAPAHRRCFSRWEHRDEFVELYTAASASDWRGRQITRDGYHLERSYADLCDWIGADLSLYLNATPEDFANPKPGALRECFVLFGHKTLLARTGILPLPKKTGWEVYVVGAPAIGLVAMRGRRMQVVRASAEIGQVEFSRGELQVIALVEGRHGFVTQMDLARVDASVEVVSGDRLRWQMP